MRTFFSVFCLVVLVGMAIPAQAQRIDQLPAKEAVAPKPSLPATPPLARPAGALSDGIAAIVNESAITMGDVRARMALALLSSGMPDAPDVRQRLLPQILRVLIEEQIQLQEARKIGIDVSDEEIHAAMNNIAQDNKIPGGDMAAFLRAHGVSPQALEQQVRAALSWNKAIVREIRPRVEVGEDEIKNAVDNLRLNVGKQEYLVSEIFLAVDKPEEEGEVRAVAEKLAEQIKGGAVFAALARQFSQGPGAAAGGDVGWVRAGELAPELDAALQSMNPSEVSGPIRSPTGYHILGLRNRRVVALGDGKILRAHIGQFFKAVSDPGELDKTVEEGNTLRTLVHGCEGAQATVADSLAGWEWEDLGDVALGEAPSWLGDAIAALDEGQAGAPVPTDRGVLVVCLCSRDIPTDMDTAVLRNAIGSEKMERMARGFLRDLRRDAYLDIRLKALP